MADHFLEFLTKIRKVEAIRELVIFFLSQKATILVAATLFWISQYTRLQPGDRVFRKFIRLLLDPATELVQAGKESGGASGEIARSPAT